MKALQLIELITTFKTFFSLMIQPQRLHVSAYRKGHTFPWRPATSRRGHEAEAFRKTVLNHCLIWTTVVSTARGFILAWLGISSGLSPDWKEETVTGVRFAEPEHQMSPFTVVSSMLVYPRMISCIVIPVIPWSPMTAIVVPVPPVFIVIVMTGPVIGTSSVSAMTYVIITIRNCWKSHCQKSEKK